MNLFEVVFLGTSGSVPVDGRNLPAIAVRYRDWVFLLDCGEDVQRQMVRAGIGLNKRMAIFITHMHADHVIGLPGLLLRFSLLGRMRDLVIYGPPELIGYVSVCQRTINLGTVFRTTVVGIDPGRVFQIENVSVDAFPVDHRGFALGYAITFQRPTGEFNPERASELGVPKGPLWGALAHGHPVELPDGRCIMPRDVAAPAPRPVRMVYSGDTRPCDRLRREAREADLLICESTYTREHANLADERGHMTAAEAAEIARDCGVRTLVITHFSPRYRDGSPVLQEAREIFENTILAQDLMRLGLDGTGRTRVIRP